MNKFCIPIKVTNEEDLYDSFLPSGLSLSGALTAYLEDYLEERKLGEGIRLELYASQEPDMEHFRNAYSAFINKLIHRSKRGIRRRILLAFAALGFGLTFILIGYAFNGRMDTVLSEIISSVGSFAMWAATAAFIETIPTLRYKSKLLKKFSRAEICWRSPESQ